MPRQTYEKVMSTKAVLKCKKDEQENVRKRRARILCGNEEANYQLNTFSRDAHHLIIKLVLCLSV